MPTDVDEGLDDAVDPEITLEPVVLRAEPGGQVQLTVKLRNPGRYVESYQLHLNGLPPSWWQASPPEVPVYAHSDATATIAISPPVGVEMPPGPIPFAVIAVSTRDDRLRVAEEADLEVGRVFAVQASISPVTSSARWSGRHKVTISNWGNGPAVLRLYGHDKDAKLGFLIRPEVVSVPVGGEASARVRARPRAPFLRGAQTHLPFQIIGDPSATGGPPQPGARPALPGLPGGAAKAAGSLAGAPSLRTPGMPPVPHAMPGMPGGMPVQGPAGVLPAPVGGFSVDGAVLQRPVWPKTAVVFLMVALILMIGLVALMVRLSDVVGAHNGDAAPDKVKGVLVAAIGPAGVEVHWQTSSRALTYQIQEIVPGTTNVKGDPRTVKAPAVALPIKVEGDPGTQVCFQVSAARLDNQGEPSAIKCATTFDGKLASPQDVKAELGPDGASVQVSWKSAPKFKHLVLNNGAQLVEVPVGHDNVINGVAAGKVCITVVAVEGTSSSAPVAAKCLTATGAAQQNGNPSSPTTGSSPGAPGSPTTPGVPVSPGQPSVGPVQTVAGGGILIQPGQPLPPVVVKIDTGTGCVKGDGTFCAAVDAEARTFIANGHPALILQSIDVNPQWFVFAQQGFADLPTAAQFCNTAGLSVCVPQSSARLVFPT